MEESIDLDVFEYSIKIQPIPCNRAFTIHIESVSKSQTSAKTQLQAFSPYSDFRCVCQITVCAMYVSHINLFSMYQMPKLIIPNELPIVGIATYVL